MRTYCPGAVLQIKYEHYLNFPRGKIKTKTNIGTDIQKVNIKKTLC